MDCDARRRSRIDTNKRNLSLRGCLVYDKSKPYRQIIVDNEQQFEKRTCILGSSLVFGVFIQNSVTISCPGGSISTMCSESVFTEVFERNVSQVIVMARTNNLFDKKNKRLMGPVETSDEMFYLIQKLKFYCLHVSILELISRRGKAETYARVNYCYRDVARELNVPFVTLMNFKAVKHLSKDGIHSNPRDIRELASDFRRAVKHTELYYTVKRYQ